MLTWPEVWRTITRILRWWPVLGTAMLLSTGTTWLLLRQQPQAYSARVTLLVGSNFTSASPDRQAVELSNVMAEYYSEVIRREVVLSPVAERLGLAFPWTAIRDFMLSTSLNRSANLLEIAVVDSSPERATAIVGAIADEVVNFSPNSPERRDVRRAAIDSQILQNQQLLNDLNQKIAELEQKQASLDSSIDVRNISDQLEKLTLQRREYQSSYDQLLLQRDSDAANSLTVFEPAEIPRAPLPKKSLLTLGVAALGGLIFAIFAVLVIDKFDTRWRTAGDLWERLKIRPLGRASYGQAHGLVARYHPTKQDVEHVFANLLLAARNPVPQVLMVTSPRVNPLRSALAIDLAEHYARAGNRVVLVDAEPSAIHASAMLGGESPGPMLVAGEAWVTREGDEEGAGWQPGEIFGHLRPTGMANVMLVSGSQSAHDAAPLVVPLLCWPKYIGALRQIADVVILDGPAALAGADAVLLAALADGVVLGLQPARDSLAQIAEVLQRLCGDGSVRLLGAVALSQEHRRQAAPARRWAGFGVAVDRGGVTISLPKRLPAGAPAPSGGPKSEVVDMEQLVAQARQTMPAQRSVGEKLSWDELVRMSNNSGERRP
jgi:succinoglycan biosynthesis transport protein ExoP